MANEDNKPKLFKKKLGKKVESHTHAGVEFKAGDEITLTQNQIDRLTAQFGDDYFEGQ